MSDFFEIRKEEAVLPIDHTMTLSKGLYISSTEPFTISINAEGFREKFREILDSMDDSNENISRRQVTMNRLIACLKGE